MQVLANKRKRVRVEGLEPSRGRSPRGFKDHCVFHFRHTRAIRCGGGGIRTREGAKALPVFQTGAIDLSATPPTSFRYSNEKEKTRKKQKEIQQEIEAHQPLPVEAKRCCFCPSAYKADPQVLGLLFGIPIHQPLSLSPVNRHLGSLCIADPSCVVAEIEFIQISVKMLLAYVMVDTVQTALEEGEIAFHGIRVDIASHVFARPMIDGLVTLEAHVQPAIRAKVIGHDLGISVDLLPHNLREVCSGHFLYGLRMHKAPLAFYQGKDRRLVRGTASRIGPTASASDIGLIGFYNPPEHISQRSFVHRMSDSVSHEPGRLIGDAEHPVELVGGDALLGGAHKMQGQKPLAEGDMAILKDSPDRDRELLLAFLALVQARASGAFGLLSAFDLIGPFSLAMGANGASRPEGILKKLPSCLFGLEYRKVCAFHSIILHGYMILADAEGFVKYITTPNKL